MKIFGLRIFHLYFDWNCVSLSSDPFEN